MAQDSCFQGARPGKHTSTGFRRLTPGSLKVDRTAEGFSGLPEEVTALGQLLAAFKAAAPHLSIAPRLVHALDWLFRFTQPQDWQKDSRPIVWPSAPRCCTDRLEGWLRVGWCGGEPSIVEGRLPCRSKPTATAGITFRSSDTGSPTGQRTMRACVPGVA